MTKYPDVRSVTADVCSLSDENSSSPPSLFIVVIIVVAIVEFTPAIESLGGGTGGRCQNPFPSPPSPLPSRPRPPSRSSSPSKNPLSFIPISPLPFKSPSIYTSPPLSPPSTLCGTSGGLGLTDRLLIVFPFPFPFVLLLLLVLLPSPDPSPSPSSDPSPLTSNDLCALNCCCCCCALPPTVPLVVVAEEEPNPKSLPL